MRPAARLWQWFQKNARDLPWRAVRVDGTRDPYHVWLAEIMLQQTQVKTVIPYYEKFLRHYPDLKSLARAASDKVFSDWAGLGYYSRARNLHACAIFVMDELKGLWPRTSAELQKLPGLGPYTAAAMAALAFGENVVALDGNVARALARVGTIGKPAATARAELIAVGETLLDKKSNGGGAEALIELGALICTPKNPKCLQCPINADCKAFQTNSVEKYPVKTKKATVKTRKAIALILTNPKGEVFTITRGARGLFAKMLAVPTSAMQAGEANHLLFEKYGARATAIGSIEHVLTHIKFNIAVVQHKLSARDATKISTYGNWMNTAEAQQQMPTLFAKTLFLL
jgi:A/G-specific adenine glycosylase